MTDAEAVLAVFEDHFSAWVATQPWACRKGCAACCSQNVTISAVEGQRILRHLRETGRERLVRAIVDSGLQPQHPRYTLNTLARACLAGKELQESEPSPTGPCPFLDQQCCSIYAARPFACRCFHSLVRCSPGRPALVDASHLAAATMINQLLEHLCQRQPWGNMLDMLPVLAIPGCQKDHTLRAQPLPGLMLEEKEHQIIAPLLAAIFASEVNGRTVESVLNGR